MKHVSSPSVIIQESTTVLPREIKAGPDDLVKKQTSKPTKPKAGCVKITSGRGGAKKRGKGGKIR